MTLITNIVAYYKFDSSNSFDSVGGNNGTDSNMTYGPGFISNGANFNGTSSRINIPTGVYSLFSGTGNFTINTWVKGSSTAFSGLDSRMFCMTNGGNFHNWVQFEVGASSMITAWRGDGTTEDVINGSTALTSTGTWYMCTYTYDGSNEMLYVNAASDATAVASTRSVNTTSVGSIGAANNSGTYISWFPTSLDEIGIWSRALSGTEITQLYNGGAGLQYPFVTTPAGSFFFTQ